MERKNSIQLNFNNGSVLLITDFKKWNLESGGQWVDLEYKGNYIGHLHNYKFKKSGDFSNGIKAYKVSFK